MRGLHLGYDHEQVFGPVQLRTASHSYVCYVPQLRRAWVGVDCRFVTDCFPGLWSIKQGGYDEEYVPSPDEIQHDSNADDHAEDSATDDHHAEDNATDAMFEPLRQTCTMLRKYNITIDDKVINDLESAPGKWNSLKKKSVLTKEMHSQAQTEEANKIKKVEIIPLSPLRFPRCWISAEIVVTRASEKLVRYFHSSVKYE